MIQKKSVLLVEDDADLRFAVVDALREEGYAVTAASNGKEAIDRLRSDTPCVVLLDMRMPVMNGIEFRRAQLADRRMARVPVVSFSASDTEQAEAQSLGISMSLSKPVDLDRLLEIVAAHCDEQAVAPSAAGAR
ncbi:MAG TPA: response regulator [Thermoanaerobaculia bacterium]